MSKEMRRVFRLCEDSVEVVFTYDSSTERYTGHYPDFERSPRFTACGRRWVNAPKDDCPLADQTYGDCGSGRYYRCEHPGDLIGVCENEQFRNK